MSGPLVTTPTAAPIAGGGGDFTGGGGGFTGGGGGFTGGGGEVSAQELTGGAGGFALDAPMGGGFGDVLPFTGISTIPLAIAGLVAAVAGALMRLSGRTPAADR